MTMENSPRATSAPPARQRPARRCRPGGRRSQPVAIFVAMVTTASASAQPSTGGIPAGSVLQPEEDEEDRGEQIPQRGEQLARAVRDLARQRDPDQERADRRRHLQLLRDARDQQRQPEYHEQQHLGSSRGRTARRSAPVAQRDEQYDADRSRARSASVDAARRAGRRRRAARSGSAGRRAIDRSSRTRIPSTTGVSRLPSRPRSPTTFAITPDDEIQVTPPSATAATGPQPSSSATAHRATAFRTKSTAPDT